MEKLSIIRQNAVMRNLSNWAKTNNIDFAYRIFPYGYIEFRFVKGVRSYITNIDFDKVTNTIQITNDIIEKVRESLTYGRSRRDDAILAKREEAQRKVNEYMNRPVIEKVIFNNPATIVFWRDGSKTVVKVQGDEVYDPEKGLAMAISKKMLGNNYAYYNEFLHWLKAYKEN